MILSFLCDTAYPAASLYAKRIVTRRARCTMCNQRTMIIVLWCNTETYIQSTSKFKQSFESIIRKKRNKCYRSAQTAHEGVCYAATRSDAPQKLFAFWLFGSFASSILKIETEMGNPLYEIESFLSAQQGMALFCVSFQLLHSPRFE